MLWVYSKFYEINMNYKKIIKSRNLRVKILSLLEWVPDRIMIPLQYRIHTGRKLNLKNPERFTEKIQLYKLNYRNSEMLRCTDKFTVREFVKEKGLEDILIPLIGIYSSPNDIHFDSLPNKFVAKTTDGGGGNQVFLCRYKSEITKHEFISKLDEWMKAPKPRKHFGREWAYENGLPRRIIIEELLTDGNKKDLPDYKFWCFDGKPVFCQVIGNRSEKETIDFFDMEWNHQPFRGLNKECDNAIITPKRPDTFEEMKQIAKILSHDFPFVRVDLYQANNKVYFGELTFYPASGYGQFTPDEWDEKIGSYFDIDSFAKNRQSRCRIRK